MPKQINLDAIRGEGIEAEFLLGGVTYKCVPEMSAMVMMDVTVAMSGMTEETLASGEKEFGEVQITAMKDYMRTVVVPEQREQFDAVIAGKTDVIVTMQQLNALLEWAMEVYSGAPLDEPSDSSNSESPSPTNFTETSSQPVRPPAFGAFS